MSDAGDRIRRAGVAGSGLTAGVWRGSCRFSFTAAGW